jgi:peptidyl-prolyl cis-trans isomerase C
MTDKKYIIFLLIVILVVAAYGILLPKILLQKNESAQNPETTPEFRLEYANTLKVKELYREAIAEYEKYIETANIPASKKANITYQIASMYLDNVHDYEKALAAFLKVELLDPKGSLVKDSHKFQVECLERLGRSRDAQEKLDQITALKSKPDPGETVIAQIGDRVVTDKEVQKRFDQLPPSMREEFNNPDKKLEFVQQFIAAELMYDSAKRKGLDRDPEIEQQAFEMKKSLMVQRLFKEEIQSQIKIEDSDLKLYFDAHKKDYQSKDKDNAKEVTFEEVKDRVKQDYNRMKQEELYRQLIERMLKAENVKIFNDKLGALK